MRAGLPLRKRERIAGCMVCAVSFSGERVLNQCCNAGPITRATRSAPYGRALNAELHQMLSTYAGRDVSSPMRIG